MTVTVEDLRLEPREQAEGLGIALETADRVGDVIQRALAIVAEGRMAEVVAQARRVYDVRVAAEHPPELPAHLRDLQ
ncbi:hypothetical protein GCM10027449_12800 [Sinomonas notoginsengisoli]